MTFILKKCFHLSFLKKIRKFYTFILQFIIFPTGLKQTKKKVKHKFLKMVSSMH